MFFYTEQGKVEIQGKPADLYTSDVDFIELVGITEPNEENFEQFSRKNSETLSTRSSSFGSFENHETINEDENCKKDEGVQLEASSKGKVKGSLFLNYFKAGARWPTLILLLLSLVFVEFLGSSVDYWVSIW